MSKPLKEAMQDLADATDQLKATLWEQRWQIGIPIAMLWCCLVLLLVAYGPNFLG